MALLAVGKKTFDDFEKIADLKNDTIFTKAKQ